MNRRDFLKASQVGLLAAGVGAGPLVVARRAFAAPPPPPPPTPLKKPVLVAIFLRGGMDQLNVIVPHGDKNYYDLRPSIAIPKAVPEGGDEGDAVIALDKQWGLHPAMQPLRPFYKSGRFAAVVNAGSPHGTRSHFDAQDFMEYAAPGLRTVRDGWLNRYLQLSRAKNGKEAELRALAMQNLLPRSLRGSYAVAAVPRTIEAAPEPEKPAAGAGRMRGNDRQALRNPLAIFDDFYGATAAEVNDAALIDDLLAEGKPAAKKAPAAAETPEMSSERTDPVFQTGRETVVKLRDVQAILARPDLASAAKYPSGENRGRYAFAEALADIAKVIKADVGLEIACVDINGWDHHQNEGGTDGTLATMLGMLSGALAAFMTDLGDRLDQVMIMTCTEFGRVCAENGNDGTDHGHGGPMLLAGGKLKGGRIYGTWPGLAPKDLYQGRDLEVTTDFRDVFAEILEQHMGFKVPAAFFPNYSAGKGLGLFAKK